MATTEEVRKLAALARIKVGDAELEKFTSEFDAILAYVESISALDVPKAGGPQAQVPSLRNVMRADASPHEPHAYTEKLAEQFPAREGDALSVKQIISHD